MLETGEYTILDLNTEIIKQFKEPLSDYDKSKLRKLKQDKKQLIKVHREYGQRKRRALERLVLDTSLTKLQFKQKYESIVSSFFYDKGATFLLSNEINRLSKKDFYYIVNDGYTRNSYRIKRSKLVESGNATLKILKKLERKVKHGAKEAMIDKKREVMALYLKKVQYNISIIENGVPESEVIKGVNVKEGRYPFIVEIFADQISLE